MADIGFASGCRESILARAVRRSRRGETGQASRASRVEPRRLKRGLGFGVLDELERERRGIYAGCVGYFGADGWMDTCIVLRTAILKDGKLYVQAGAGIVADSQPKLEQLECENKARALFSAAEEALRYASEARVGQ